MDVAHLEDYIRTARVLQTTQLPGGGGHQNKQLLILEGGLGVAAKLAEPDPIASQRVRAEVAAWTLAQDLGWTDLVPTTAIRAVRSSFSGNDVAASVQIMWPRLTVAAENKPPLTVNDCPESDIWRVALFDALCANTDRNDTNWGIVSDLKRPKLIDHGHAFVASQISTSPFFTMKGGQTIPGEHVPRLEGLLARGGETAMRDVLSEADVEAVITRAESLVRSGTMQI